MMNIRSPVPLLLDRCFLPHWRQPEAPIPFSWTDASPLLRQLRSSNPHSLGPTHRLLIQLRSTAPLPLDRRRDDGIDLVVAGGSDVHGDVRGTFVETFVGPFVGTKRTLTWMSTHPFSPSFSVMSTRRRPSSWVPSSLVLPPGMVPSWVSSTSPKKQSKKAPSTWVPSSSVLPPVLSPPSCDKTDDTTDLKRSICACCTGVE